MIPLKMIFGILLLAICASIASADLILPPTSCPQYMPPAPGWCANGTIVPQPADSDGCSRPARCVYESNTSSNVSIINGSAQVCPQYMPPPAGWCANGTIVPQPVYPNGCIRPPQCIYQQQNVSVGNQSVLPLTGNVSLPIGPAPPEQITVINASANNTVTPISVPGSTSSVVTVRMNGTNLTAATFALTKSESKTTIREGLVEATSNQDLSVKDSKLVMQMQSGNSQELTILPEAASANAVGVQTVTQVQIVEQNGAPSYSVSGKSEGRFLFLIPVSVAITQSIDAQSGNVTSTQRPWWAFLVSGI